MGSSHGGLGKRGPETSFASWAAHLEPCASAWNTVLETLELGESIADPTRGPLVC
jgi:hypothetical protein